MDIARVKPPESDELFLVNVPEFLGVKHKEFDYATYEPPTRPHDGRDPSEGKFSAFSTANTSIFWRRDPKNPEKIQSNARIIRWSDGSFTLQLASKPTEQYRISTTAMRPSWPRKAGSSHDQYDPNRESNNYLGAPHATPGCDLQIVAPFDASMKISPTGDTADAAELQLRESIAARSVLNDGPSSFKSVREDPELAKKRAEKAEKDVAKATRRREAMVDKQMSRKDKVLGRAGLRGHGLTVGGLEDDMPTARGRKSNLKKRKSTRSGAILSDSEDEETYHRRGRDDEYDLDDGFVADSDEDPEVYDDDNGSEEIEEDETDKDDRGTENRNKERKKGGNRKGDDRPRERERTPKRSRDDLDDDNDAEAEDDPDARAGPVRRKQRRIADESDSG